MIRSVVLIAAAIQLSQPKMPAHTALTYATVVQQEAKKRNFDPFTLVAIIHKESWWTPSAISPSGNDLGLAQIRFRFLGPCRNDPDPVHDPSPACQALKSSLLDPIYNIRFAAQHITGSREFCAKKVGRVTEHGWLAAWQGTQQRGKWCQKNSHTISRLKYRDKLAKMAARGQLHLRNRGVSERGR